MVDDNRQLSILTTEDDKHSYDIEKLSNFFDGYIRHLSTKVASYSFSEIVDIIPAIDIGIINEALSFADIFVKGKNIFVPDFDSLPADILRKLKKGIYTIGESRQVEDNFRAVILDENGVRIKDITLKKIMNPAETADSIRNLSEQAQLRQINKKLGIIEELQNYQIDTARNQNIFIPFFNARDAIARAQETPSIEERKRYLDSAVASLTSAINAIYADMITLKKNIYKLTRFPIFQQRSTIYKYINIVAEDLQNATKFIGLQMQVFDYQDASELAKLELEKFKVFMSDFAYTKIGHSKKSFLQLIQGSCPHNVAKMWNGLGTDIEPFLMLEENKIDELYLITAEDVIDAKETNNS